MTLQEFSNGFTTLLNSYGSIGVFGDEASHREIVLDEYEKSVHLTMAQEEMVINLYSGKNIYGEAFENTEEMRRYLDALVKSEVCTSTRCDTPVSRNSVFYELPDDLAFIVYEQVTWDDDRLGCYDGNIADVYPITHDEYNKIRRNPFRGATKYRVLRLDAGDNAVELISKYSFKDYLIRYVARPNPIILEDLPDGLTINGQSHTSECELNPMLHDAILRRAVQLALVSRGIQLS